MGDNECHDELNDVGSDNNLYLKLKCRAFSERRYDFRLTMKEFFEEMKIQEPLFKLSNDKNENILYIKMMSQDDKDRLLQLYKDEKDRWILYKTPVTVSVVRESLESGKFNRTFTLTNQEALDLLLPLRKIPWETQVKEKVELLKSCITDADKVTKQHLEKEKLIRKKYFPSIPSFEEPIKPPSETGFLTENVYFNLEYDIKNRSIEAGVNVIIGREKRTYHFLPAKDCVHIAPPIIEVVENFMEYLTSNLEELKEFGHFNEESNTGFVRKLQCTVGDKGEVLLSVILSYYSNNEEFVPLEEIDDPVNLKQMLEWYRSQQNEQQAVDEQMQVDPQDESKPHKRRVPEWSSESGNPKGYKFVGKDFRDCHPSFRYFDFSVADSHLDVAVPFLRKFYDEYKTKTGLCGIYVSWYNVSMRPADWNRYVEVYHHVCGDSRVVKNVKGFPMNKFPFSLNFGPIFPNYNLVLEQLMKMANPDKTTDLAILCESSLVFIFFAKKCRNIIALNEETNEQLRVAKNTKTRIIYAGHNLNQIDFAYRKIGGPPSALIIWGYGKARSAVIKRFIEYGVKKLIFYNGTARFNIETGSSKNPVVNEIARINRLVYPYLSLKKIVPIDCQPGTRHLPFISLYEKNDDAPPLPPVLLHKLTPELESKLPRTAIPPTDPKRLYKTLNRTAGDKDDGEPESKRSRNDFFDGKRGGKKDGGRGQDKGRGRGRGRGGVRGRGRGGRSDRTATDPDKAELLRQIEQLKAQQEEMRKLLPGSRSSPKPSSRDRGERGGNSRQEGSRGESRDYDRGGKRGGNSRQEGSRGQSRDYDRGGERGGNSRQEGSRGQSRDYDRGGNRYSSSRQDSYGGRNRGETPRRRNDFSPDRRSSSRDYSRRSDGNRHGGGSSRTTDSERNVGSGYDYRKNMEVDEMYERRNSGHERALPRTGSGGYTSAYEERNVQRGNNTEPSPPPPTPPPPPILSRY